MPIRPLRDLLMELEVSKLTEGNVFKGKKVRQRTVPFRRTAGETIGSYAGLPAFMLRLKRIEDWMEETGRKLERSWIECADDYGDQGSFAQEWGERVGMVDLGGVNTLIRNHNRYYPIEANLPSEPESGHVMEGGKPFRELALLTHQTLLELFPPRLEAARQRAREVRKRERESWLRGPLGP